MAQKPKRSGPKADAKTRPGAETKRATGAASRLIDERIRSVGGWRAETLAEIRRLIHEADPDIVEECKWIKPGNPLGVPVWSHAGIVCTGEAYKEIVKLTFGVPPWRTPGALQLQSGGEHASRHRHPGGRSARCRGVQGPDPGRGRGESALQRLAVKEPAADVSRAPWPCSNSSRTAGVI